MDSKAIQNISENYGFPWKYEAYCMCQKHENVHMTLSWHFNELVHYNKFLAWQELDERRIYAGIDKIIYVSDFPVSPNLKEVIDFLKYEEVSDEMKKLGFNDWTYEMRAKVLGLNAAKVLGIKNKKIEEIKKSLKIKSNVSKPNIKWSDETNQILNKIPRFIRGNAVKEIENYAYEHDTQVITPKIMEKARNN